MFILSTTNNEVYLPNAFGVKMIAMSNEFCFGHKLITSNMFLKTTSSLG